MQGAGGMEQVNPGGPVKIMVPRNLPLRRNPIGGFGLSRVRARPGRSLHFPLYLIPFSSPPGMIHLPVFNFPFSD